MNIKLIYIHIKIPAFFIKQLFSCHKYQDINH